jgi:hypothetical protein
MTQFLVSYRHAGSEYNLLLPADNWADAEAKLRSIQRHARVIGSDVMRVPANALTFPFAGLFARLLVWWRNRK